jgi:uncharacterized 2Fe-2S/4Fe-4S cluster protein (DUF4445 family)
MQKSTSRVRLLPSGREVEVPRGTSLPAAIEKSGLAFELPCGGEHRCGKCKVRVRPGTVPPTPHANLSREETDDGVRLACRLSVDEDLEVYVLPRFFALDDGPVLPEGEPQRLTEALSLRLKMPPADPLVRSIRLSVPAPSLSDQTSDAARLKRALERDAGRASEIAVPLDILQGMPKRLGKPGFPVEAALFQAGRTSEIVELAPARDRPTKLLGAAIDVGTTTIGVNLLDLETGRVVSHAAGFNDQIRFGDDVIARMVYAARPEGAEKLREAVLFSIRKLLAAATGAIPEAAACLIGAVGVAGNTVMTHLLLGLDTATIRNEPYVPVTNEYPRLPASELGLPALPRAPVLVTPTVSGYLGGDIVAGLLASGMHLTGDLTLYVDIGTNGEMVLGNREWMVGCACSAGPAFEGGSLRFGMRAVEGAIDHISYCEEKGGLQPHVIGENSPPRGICGSGMIDLLYQLYYNGLMNQKGKLDIEKGRKAVISGPEGNCCRLRGSGDRVEEPPVTVSEGEIENLIRTKGAVWAGIHTLLKNLSIRPADIAKVVIAGNFGRSLDIRHAIGIGMLPDIPADRYSYIGNGSLLGASLALLSRSLCEQAAAIARNITYMELAAVPGYMEEFVASLFIPHTDRSLFPSHQFLPSRTES